MSYPNTEENFWKQVKTLENGCIVWTQAKDTNGYGLFRLNGKLWKSHRIAWIFKNGKIPEGLQVLHKCDNPPCVNLDHLFLGTARENIDDMMSKGRQLRGEKNHKTKLTERDVQIIRLLKVTISEPSYTGYKLAKIFKVHFSTIDSIAARRTWKHVPDFSVIEAAQVFQEYKHHFNL